MAQDARRERSGRAGEFVAVSSKRESRPLESRQAFFLSSKETRLRQLPRHPPKVMIEGALRTMGSEERDYQIA